MSASLDDLFDQPRGSKLRDLIKFAQDNKLEVGSTTGGRHNRGSKHYSGNAIDIRNSGGMTDEQVRQLSHSAASAGLKLRDERRRPLGQPVWGGPHVHLETDPQSLNDLFDSGQTLPVSQRQRQNPPIPARTPQSQPVPSRLPPVFGRTAGISTEDIAAGVATAERPRQQVAIPDWMRRVNQQRAIEQSRRQQATQTRQAVEQEYRGRRGAYGSPTLAGALHVVANPVSSLTGLFRSDEENINRETEERVRQQQVASEPEVESIRREYGQMSVPRRVATSSLAKGGAGLLKTAGGIASAFGIAPNRLSEWANKRGEIIEAGAGAAPLAEERGLTSLITGEPTLREVERGIPEKIAIGVADLGVGLGQIILLKKATGLKFNQLLALEAAARNSDKSVDEQLSRAGEAYALGTALDRHLSRPVSAAISGAPAAAQTGYEVSQGRMSPLDAAIQTGIQTSAGAILTTPKPRQQRRATPETFTEQRQARIAEQEASRYGRPDLTRKFDKLEDLFDEPVTASETVITPKVEAVDKAVIPRLRIEEAIETAARQRDRLGQFESELAQWRRAGGQSRRGRARIQTLQRDIAALRGEIDASRQQAEQQVAGEQAQRVETTRYSPTPRFDEWVENQTGQRMGQLPETDIATLRERYRTEFANAPQPPLVREMPPLDAPLQRFYHRDYGEVTEAPNQRKAGKGRVKVLDEQGREHYIKRVDLTGRGNQRAIPVREFQPLPESQPPTTPAAKAVEPAAAPTVPERPETIDAQLTALIEGRRDAVLVPRGTPEPQRPRRMARLETEVGTFYFDPRKTSRYLIERKVKDGSYGELLGHVEPKPQLGEPTAVVTAREGDTEVQSSAVSPERAQEQARVTQVQNPEAQVEVGGPELAQEVIADRARPSSTKNAAIEELRRDLDLAEMERPERKSFQQSIDNAVVKGYDKQAERIADEVIKGNREVGLDNERTAGLLIRIRELENQWEDIRRTDPRSPELQPIKQQLDRLSQAADLGGTAPARDLAFRRSMVDKEFRLINLIRQAEKAKGREVTPEETARYDTIVKERDAAIRERDIALERLHTKTLQRELDKSTKQRQRQVSKEAIDTEWNSLKAQLAEIKAAQTEGFFRSERGALDPEVAKIAVKMMRNRVKAGLSKAEDVISEIHAAVGGARRDVAESLAGYPQATKQRAELERNLAQVRGEIAKALKEQDVIEGRRSTRQEGPKRDWQRNQQRIKQLEEREREYERRIAARDFGPRAKEPYPYSPEVRALEDRVSRAEAKFYKEMERAKGGHQLRNLSGIYKAWLLSGPITHVKNIGGTGLYQVFSEGARLPAVVVDAAISGGRQAIGLPAQRGISGPSPSAMLQSAAHAAKVGGREALDILRRGATKEQMERHQFQAIDFGVNTGKPAIDRGVKMIELAHNAIFRFMAASDRVFYRHAYQRNLIDRATIQARNEGLTGKQRADRAKELINDPPEQLDADARHDALVSTFNNNNALSTKIKAARAATIKDPRLSKKAAERINAAENLALDFILPFDRTPTNVVMRILEASPAGYLKNAKQLVSAAIKKSMTVEDQRQFSQTFGKATAGTALIGLGWTLADSLFDVDDRGVVTLKLGDKKIRLDFVSPVGNLIATGVRLRKVHKEEAKKSPSKQNKFIKDTKVIGREVANIPILGATSRVSELITDPERSAAKTGSRMLYGLTPFSGATRQLGEFLDPKDREAKGLKEHFQRNVPIWRQRLTERKPKQRAFSGFK